MENKLGYKAKDSITGFEGIVTARIEYINGCVQYCVKPLAGKDAKMPEGEWIDEGQLTFGSKKVVKIKAKDTGGVMSDSPKGYGLSRK